MNYKSGRYVEWSLTRDLFKYLRLTARRIPASGRGTKKLEKDPDVIAGGFGRYFAFEVKSAGKNRSIIYIEEEDVNSLLDFCLKFQASPWLAVRFYRKPFRFAKPSDLERTKKGTYKFRIGSGISIKEVVL
jgi:Holliday junction resolvase